MRFTTIDPVGTGIAAQVGEYVSYVSGPDGYKSAAPYIKYGTGDKDWVPVPDRGGAETVTFNPQVSGLRRAIGSRCIYAAPRDSSLHVKYGPGDTDWCLIYQSRYVEPATTWDWGSITVSPSVTIDWGSVTAYVDTVLGWGGV